MSSLQTIAILVGVVSGVSGLVLGILNYLHQRDTTRPRVVVRPCVWSIRDSDTKLWKNVGVMEFRNVGCVPVIGEYFGFPLRRGREGAISVTPESINGSEWAAELKPQHVAMMRFKLEGLGNPDVVGRAFAVTIVGDRFKASRRDMRNFVRQWKVDRLREPPPAAPCKSSQESRTPSGGPDPAAGT